MKVFYNFVLTTWALIRVFVTPVRGQTYMNQLHAAATFRTCCCPMTPVDNSRSDATLHIGSNVTALRTTQSAA